MYVDHHTDFALEFVKFLNTPMSQTSTTSIPMLQIFFICMCLYSNDSRDNNGAWKACSETGQRRIIRNMLRYVSESNPAQTEVLVIGKVAHQTPRVLENVRDCF